MPQASNSEPTKRKRGRPANASTAINTNASQDRPEATEEYEADADETSRPRKRGRPRKSLESQDGEASPGPQPRKRGRPSLEGAKTQATEAPEDQVGPQKLSRKKNRAPPPDNQTNEQHGTEPAKRGRKKKDESLASRHGIVQDRVEDPGEESDQPRRRGRKPAQAEQEKEVEPDSGPRPTSEAPRRKRGRPSLEKDQNREAEQQDPEQDVSRPRKRGRASLQEVEAAEAQNQAAEPSKQKSRRHANRQDETGNQDSSKGKKKRGRPSLENNEEPQEDLRVTGKHKSKAKARQDEVAMVEGTKTNRGRRRSSQDAPAEESPPPSPEKPYLHLVPRTRHIRPSTIAAKWAPLSGASVPAAASLLELAQRPILQRMASTSRRHGDSKAALRMIMHRIGKKLSKGLPFPPALASPSFAVEGRGRGARKSAHSLDSDGGREVELDFESVLDGKAVLDRQLGPGLHAVELLRREKARMERELERDYEALRKLESSARAQARERKDQFKKAHVLAPAARTSPPPDQETIITSTLSGGDIFKVSHHRTSYTLPSLGASNLDTHTYKHIPQDIKANQDLHPLALQLADHVDSIRGNLSQAAGITPQLARTRAGLRAVLSRHLDREAYEQVVLG